MCHFSVNKVHSCSFERCGKKFRRSDALKNHIAVHHSSTKLNDSSAACLDLQEENSIKSIQEISDLRQESTAGRPKSVDLETNPEDSHGERGKFELKVSYIKPEIPQECYKKLHCNNFRYSLTIFLFPRQS